MKRTVIVCQLADRHADFHTRAFSVTRHATVADSDLRTVVDTALANVGFEHGARFVITVEEPHE